MDAILWVARGGYGWGLLPHVGRDPQPSAGIADSQSVETAGVGGERGYDGGKEIEGRTRHLLVDTEGLVLRLTVHPANVMDREGIESLLEGASARSPRLERLWLDPGYNGTGKGKDRVEQAPGRSAEVVAHPRTITRVRARVPPPPGFRVLPRRWMVERTLQRLGQDRRLGKDYERLCGTS